MLFRSQKPYYIPANTKIVYSVFMMQRRTDLWGPDGEWLAAGPAQILPLVRCLDANPRIPVLNSHTYVNLALEFDPDRFLDNRVREYLVKNSFIFLPFNAGPRICLGQQVRFFICRDASFN